MSIAMDAQIQKSQEYRFLTFKLPIAVYSEVHLAVIGLISSLILDLSSDRSLDLVT